VYEKARRSGGRRSHTSSKRTVRVVAAVVRPQTDGESVSRPTAKTRKSSGRPRMGVNSEELIVNSE
jgi:hypothetical protein